MSGYRPAWNGKSHGMRCATEPGSVDLYEQVEAMAPLRSPLVSCAQPPHQWMVSEHLLDKMHEVANHSQIFSTPLEFQDGRFNERNAAQVEALGIGLESLEMAVVHGLDTGGSSPTMGGLLEKVRSWSNAGNRPVSEKLLGRFIDEVIGRGGQEILVALSEARCEWCMDQDWWIGVENGYGHAKYEIRGRYVTLVFTPTLADDQMLVLAREHFRVRSPRYKSWRATGSEELPKGRIRQIVTGQYTLDLREPEMHAYVHGLV